MSDANRALAEVRSWLCDNLGSGDAGKVCGMLSVVSRRINEIEDENAKLRELVRKYGEYTSQDRCEGCACKSRCNDGDVDECWQLTEIRGLARELGVEVD